MKKKKLIRTEKKEKERGKIANASLCPGCTVRPSKLKCWNLKLRKVCWRQMAQALKSPILFEEFQQSTFKRQVKESLWG